MIMNLFSEKTRKIGMISTFLTKQFFEKYLDIFEIPRVNIEEYFRTNKITTILIDNDLYEEDHPWHKKDLDGLLLFLKLHNVEIYIVKNSEKNLNNTYRDYSIININPQKIEYKRNSRNKIIDLPVIVDEFKFNPIDLNKQIDTLYLNKGKLSRGEGIQLLQEKIRPVRKEIVFDTLSRKLIKEIIESIKKSKILYIYKPETFDRTFLKYIEVISVLQNTVVVYNSENINSNIVLNNPEILNINYMAIIKEDTYYTDKILLKMQRKAFLDHTSVMYHELNDIFLNKPCKPFISVITPTNRRQYLHRYIEQLNNQTIVELEVILLAHGLNLTDHEKYLLMSKSNFNLKIIDVDKHKSLGFCLNMGITHASCPFIAKMDDDDFYFENYLLDSWLAKMFSQADLVGKHSTFTYLDSVKVTLQNNSNSVKRYQNFVMGATFFSDKMFMSKYMFSNLPTGEDSDFLRRINDDKALIYTDHPYNFCIYRSDNVNSHTWKRSDIEFFRNAIIAHHGEPEEYISL